MLKVGILGCGAMASVMAKTLRAYSGTLPYACASRSLEKAKAFAEKEGFEKAFGSYEELLADPEPDLVYVATPHSRHGEDIALCARYGKAVLCEKAFTLNAAQAEAALAAGEKAGVLLTEAIWVRYLPMAKILRDFAASGRIGRITSVSANLGYAVSERDRVSNPLLGGGSLLDVGVYCLNFISLILGDEITDVSADAELSEGGIDLQCFATLTYAGGAKAQLYSSIVNPTDRMGIIYGTEGYAIVGNVNNYEYLEIYAPNHSLIERIDRPEQISGYEYQLEACERAIAAGALECPEMPHAETLTMMKVMDRIRAAAGIVYPCEK